jgi:hypothetical protein
MLSHHVACSRGGRMQATQTLGGNLSFDNVSIKYQCAELLTGECVFCERVIGTATFAERNSRSLSRLPAGL